MKFQPDKVIDFDIDYYQVLGLEKGCLPDGKNTAEKQLIVDILNKAYQKAAFSTHPDFAQTEEESDVLNEKFKLVVRAHTILSNSLYREYYESGGEYKPKMVENGSEMEVDWDNIGTYQEGSLQDTVGNKLFLKICDLADDLKLVPAFKPTSELHNYEWDFVIKNETQDIYKLSISCVSDEDDVLRLSSSKQVQSLTTLPFKIYICIPRSVLHCVREAEQNFSFMVKGVENKYKLNGILRGASYSDVILLESTCLETAMHYVSSDEGLSTHINKLLDGSLMEEQKERDKLHSQTQCIPTDELKKNDIERMKAIIKSKAFFTVVDMQASKIIDNLPENNTIQKKKFYKVSKDTEFTDLDILNENQS